MSLASPVSPVSKGQGLDSELEKKLKTLAAQKRRHTAQYGKDEAVQTVA
jgi:hypothetical protein